MKTILIFGAGDNQLTLIKGAKALGYKTVVIDPNPEAVGKKYADVFETVAPKDYQATKNLAQQYQVDGIVTCQMENPLLLMSKLAEDMGFIFPSVDSIKKARDKFLMKQAFIKHGVPCAKGFLMTSADDLEPSDIQFPAIIKPVDAFSSRGVYKLLDYSDIKKFFDKATSLSSNNKAIVEEFIDGKEYSVEAVTCNGLTHVIQITEKKITPFPNTVELAQIQPSGVSQKDQKDIENIINQSVKALGLDNCATHGELKLTPEGPKMIEIGARLGGDYITSHLVPLSTGVNIEQLAVQIALGDYNGFKESINRGVVIKYLELEPNKKVEKIGAWEHLLDAEDVAHAGVFIKEGETTQAITDSAKRAGFVIVTGNDKVDAEQKANKYAKELETLIKLK